MIGPVGSNDVRLPGRSAPADGMLHPVILGAVALLLLNDHVLKQAMPGLLTGKLSDVAGLVFFPLLLVGIWEVAAVRLGGAVPAGRFVVAVMVIVSGVAFASVKTVPLANQAYRETLGAMQWPFTFAASIADGGPAPAFVPVRLAADPTDLVALPVLLVPFVIGWRRADRGAPRGSNASA